MKRKRNVVTIEIKLETMDQLAIRVRVPFLAVRYKSVLLFDYPKKSIIRSPLVPISSDNRRSTVHLLSCFYA